MSKRLIEEQKPKQKPDLHRGKILVHYPPVPPMPTGEKASGSQDKSKNNNPESGHESKGKRGRPRNTQPKPNTQGPPPVKKDNLTKTKPQTQKDQTMTPKRI